MAAIRIFCNLVSGRLKFCSYNCLIFANPDLAMHFAIYRKYFYTNFRVIAAAMVILISGLSLSTAIQAADTVGVIKFARGDVTIKSVDGKTRKAVKEKSLYYILLKFYKKKMC